MLRKFIGRIHGKPTSSQRGDDEMEQTIDGWLTTSQLLHIHGVPMHTTRRWVSKLRALGHARKLDGGRGIWLVSEESVPFLVSRSGKRGRPSGDQQLPPRRE